MAEEKEYFKGKPGPGRPKGCKDKVTTDVKNAILNAFKTVGGEDYLVTVARENPTVFCSLLGKVLPLTVSTEGKGEMTIRWEQ